VGPVVEANIVHLRKPACYVLSNRFQFVFGDIGW